MSLLFEERGSDSPHVESITRGWTVSDGSSIRPAEPHWHMVFTKYQGIAHPIFVAPMTTAGIASWGADAELLWVKFKLGTFMPHLPAKSFLNSETVLENASSKSFWLNSSVWEYPDYENVEAFVGKLVREDVLAHDPLVNAVLQDQPQQIASRTVRHRFLRATGLTQSHIRQVERARDAEILLRQGKSILDTVDELGYFDQPHLTRSLKQWIGYTPAQLARSG